MVDKKNKFKVKEEKERLKADVAELRTLSNKLQQDIGQVESSSSLHQKSSCQILLKRKHSVATILTYLISHPKIKDSKHI